MEEEEETAVEALEGGDITNTGGAQDNDEVPSNSDNGRGV